MKTLARLAGEIKATLQKVHGAAEVMTVSNATVGYLEAKVDRMMAGRARLPVTRIEGQSKQDHETRTWQSTFVS